MKSARCQVSSCSRCRFYAPEGRRGGQCSQLGVPVESRWKPCSLAAPVFEAPLVELQPLNFLPQTVELTFAGLQLETTLLQANLELEPPGVVHPVGDEAHLDPALMPVAR